MDERLELLCMSYTIDDIIDMAGVKPEHVLKLLIMEGLVNVEDYFDGQDISEME